MCLRRVPRHRSQRRRAPELVSSPVDVGFGHRRHVRDDADRLSPLAGSRRALARRFYRAAFLGRDPGLLSHGERRNPLARIRRCAAAVGVRQACDGDVRGGTAVPARRPIEKTAITVRPITFVTGLITALLVLQPHLGAILVIGAIVFTMFLAGTARPSAGLGFGGASPGHGVCHPTASRSIPCLPRPDR